MSPDWAGGAGGSAWGAGRQVPAICQQLAAARIRGGGPCDWEDREGKRAAVNAESEEQVGSRWAVGGERVGSRWAVSEQRVGSGWAAGGQRVPPKRTQHVGWLRPAPASHHPGLYLSSYDPREIGCRGSRLSLGQRHLPAACNTPDPRPSQSRHLQAGQCHGLKARPQLHSEAPQVTTFGVGAFGG